MLRKLCQSEIDIVASEDQVLPNRDTMQREFIAIGLVERFVGFLRGLRSGSDSNQCKVGGPAPNVADKNCFTFFDAFLPVGGVPSQPCIEGCLRLFDR